MPRLSLPFHLLLHCLREDEDRNLFVGSTKLAVCRNQRSNGHKVVRRLAQQTYSSLGWFFGFKLYLLIHDKVRRMAVELSLETPMIAEPMKNHLMLMPGKLPLKGTSSLRLPNPRSTWGLSRIQTELIHNRVYTY